MTRDEMAAKVRATVQFLKRAAKYRIEPDCRLEIRGARECLAELDAALAAPAAVPALADAQRILDGVIDQLEHKFNIGDGPDLVDISALKDCRNIVAAVNAFPTLPVADAPVGSINVEFEVDCDGRVHPVEAAAMLTAAVPTKCPDCGHQPHKPGPCYNMASDNDCNCGDAAPAGDAADELERLKRQVQAREGLAAMGVDADKLAAEVAVEAIGEAEELQAELDRLRGELERLRVGSAEWKLSNRTAERDALQETVDRLRADNAVLVAALNRWTHNPRACMAVGPDCSGLDGCSCPYCESNRALAAYAAK